jgi:hypothetical protein
MSEVHGGDTGASMGRSVQLLPISKAQFQYE